MPFCGRALPSILRAIWALFLILFLKWFQFQLLPVPVAEGKMLVMTGPGAAPFGLVRSVSLYQDSHRAGPFVAVSSLCSAAPARNSPFLLIINISSASHRHSSSCLPYSLLCFPKQAPRIFVVGIRVSKLLNGENQLFGQSGSFI